MPCLCEKLQLLLNRQLALVRLINCLDAPGDLLHVLLYILFGSKMTLTVEGWSRNVADVFHQVLAQAVRQRLYVVALPELLHHLPAALNPGVVIASRLESTLPLVIALQMIQKPRITFPFLVVFHLSDSFPDLENIVFQNDQVDQFAGEIL